MQFSDSLVGEAMRATQEDIEQFKAGNNFETLAEKIWTNRKAILESKGCSAGSLEEFKRFLNKIVVGVMSGPDQVLAVNNRLSIALQGSKVQWELKGRSPPEDSLADARDFISGAAEEFGVSDESERDRKIAKRYKPLFDEAYRRKPRKE
jgi:hypothetical protein